MDEASSMEDDTKLNLEQSVAMSNDDEYANRPPMIMFDVMRSKTLTFNPKNFLGQ